MKYCLILILVMAGVAALSVEHQVVGGCTTIVVEGGTHSFNSEFPYEECTLNYWPVTRSYDGDGKPSTYQCITTAQACNFKVDIPEAQ